MGAEKKLVVMSRAEEMTRFAEAAHRDGHTIALVPTMGNLHEGHVSLVQAARDHADIVVVSIFVNPTQFAAGEDFDTYPRTLEQDIEKLQDLVDLVFAPSVDEVYPPGEEIPVVHAGPIGDVFEGASRPGHFDGVLTVCKRLFRLTAADVAVFGEKDAQQLFLVTQMVATEGLPVQIVAVPTVRDTDGVALSSRNAYLTEEERKAAIALPNALELARSVIELSDVASALGQARKQLDGIVGVELDYLDVVSADSFQPPALGETSEVIVIGAVRVGTTRLIDNMRTRLR